MDLPEVAKMMFLPSSVGVDDITVAEDENVYLLVLHMHCLNRSFPGEHVKAVYRRDENEKPRFVGWKAIDE